MPGAPVLLAPGVWRIPTLGRSAINSFAFVDASGEVTLVDAGLRRAPRAIRSALAAIGAKPGDVRRIVLTHAHADHAGGLGEVRAGTGGRTAAHSADAGFARRGEPPPLDRRSLPARVFAMMPGRGFPASPIDETFEDDELLPVAGGLRVVHTPGHSPGHVSLLHEPSGVLITGDALFNLGRLGYSWRFVCTDVPLSRETAGRLAGLDFEIAAFTHGPEIREHARQAVRRLVEARR